jgi:hypothetical protein
MDPEQINNKLYSGGNTDGYEKRSIYQTHLLEQYKTYVTSAENISNRRQAANAFFVSVNTVLISLVGYLNLGAKNSTKMYWVISVAGIAISYMWYRLVRSYKDLNTAKFKVVHEIEKNLPISPYDAEWEAVGRGENSKLYLPFTYIEIFVPWMFLALHLIVLAVYYSPIAALWFCKVVN